MDARAQQAREHHAAADQASQDAYVHRRQRDRLVRALRADDPDQWTYVQLAAAVGCSKELVATIIKGGVKA